MWNKISLKSGLFVVLLSLVFFSSKVSALGINVDIDGGTWSDVKDGISHIHFVDNWNDFWGMMLLSWDTQEAGLDPSEWDSSEDPIEPVGSTIVQIGDSKYTCQSQLKWLYYNSERGERLWPLDQDTNDSLFRGDNAVENFTWGLYFFCWTEEDNENYAQCVAEEESEDGSDSWDWSDSEEECSTTIRVNYPGIYWMTSYSYKGQDFSLIAGVEYSTWGNWVDIKADSKLSPTFDRFDPQKNFLLGFVYDTNGGIGFVWCEFTWLDKKADLKNMVNLVTRKWTEVLWTTESIYDQIFEMEEGGEFPKLRADVVWVSMDCKNIWVWPTSLLSLIVDGLVWMWMDSDRKNVANTESSEKMQYFSSVNLNNAVLINYAKKKAELLCRWKWTNYPNTTDSIVCISGANIDASDVSYSGKTLIVKNGNVTVKPSRSNKYDVFVDKGFLVIDPGTSGDYLVFNKEGFPTNVSLDEYATEIVNSPLWVTGYDGDNVAVGKLLQWNFIVNGLVKPSNWDTKFIDKYFVHGKFTSLNTFQDPGDSYAESLEEMLGSEVKKSMIEIWDVFAWYCNSYIWSDGRPCPHNNEYYKSPFIVIERNFPSVLVN